MSRHRWIPVLLAAALWGLATSAGAASIDDLTVRETAGRYLIAMHAHLNARAGDAYAVFANLANLRSINSDLREATILGPAALGGVRLYTVFRACVLWYCRSIRETQTMTFARGPDGGEVDDIVLPSGGDLRSGHARWLFRSAGGQSVLEATAEFEPAFRVPPLIGPWLVRRWLRIETERAVANIETLARSPVTSSPPRTAR
ncbi:MAG: hypothetical protein WBE92_11035 [Steroidobacteraceae bacterium]